MSAYLRLVRNLIVFRSIDWLSPLSPIFSMTRAISMVESEQKSDDKPETEEIEALISLGVFVDFCPSLPG